MEGVKGIVGHTSQQPTPQHQVTELSTWRAEMKMQRQHNPLKQNLMSSSWKWIITKAENHLLYGNKMEKKKIATFIVVLHIDVWLVM